MKLYRIAVEQEDEWFCLCAVNDPQVYTQARSLDEAIFMVRDVVELLYDEKHIQIELVVPPDITTPFERRWAAKEARKKSRRAAAARTTKRKPNAAAAVA